MTEQTDTEIEPAQSVEAGWGVAVDVCGGGWCFGGGVVVGV